MRFEERPELSEAEALRRDLEALRAIEINDQIALAARQFADDCARSVREFVERDNYMEPVQPAGFSDNYLRGNIKIALVSPFGNWAKLGFTIEVPQVGEAPVWHMPDSFPRLNPVSAECLGQGLEVEQIAMLANNIHVMELPEQIVPTLVRLQEFDFVSYIQPKTVYEFSALVPARDKGIPTFSNGKLDLTFVAIGRGFRQFHRKYIERATDNIDISADLDGERERDRLFCSHYQKVLPGIAILFSNTHIYMRIEPSLGSFLEGWKVGFNPIDTCESE